MTIKQQGGIFGRNPTFKNVSATDLNVSTLTATTANASTLTTTAAIIDNYVDIKSSGTVRGNIYADASNMYINTQGTNTNLNANGGDVVLGNANLVINTSGKGIDFSATSGTGTSELFDDYEEGTWTPVPVPTSGAITTYTSSGTYTKVGREVTIIFNITISDVGTASALSTITGNPFTNHSNVSAGCGREAGVTGAMWQYTVGAGGTAIVGKSYANDPGISSGVILYGSVTYFV